MDDLLIRRALLSLGLGLTLLGSTAERMIGMGGHWAAMIWGLGMFIMGVGLGRALRSRAPQAPE